MTQSDTSNSPPVALGPSDWDTILYYLDHAGLEGTFAGARANWLARQVRKQLPPDRHRGRVEPMAAADRALQALDEKQGFQGGDLHEAIKELAHGLASLTRTVYER